MCSRGNALILKRPVWFAAPVRDNTEVGYRGITRRFCCGFWGDKDHQIQLYIAETKIYKAICNGIFFQKKCESYTTKRLLRPRLTGVRRLLGTRQTSIGAVARASRQYFADGFQCRLNSPTQTFPMPAKCLELVTKMKCTCVRVGVPMQPVKLFFLSALACLAMSSGAQDKTAGHLVQIQVTPDGQLASVGLSWR